LELPVTSYLNWLIASTATRWWHDSADPGELGCALERGAVGVTTNPVLASVAMKKNRARWQDAIDRVVARGLPPEQKAEELMRIAVTRAAERVPGYVCAQVNPARAADRECMAAMAKRFHAWAPNIAVKLPATAAGLDVLEECVASGITATATVSFTVPQVIAIAERHRAGQRRARERGLEPGRCFAVIMIGRVDDYLRDVARDAGADASEADICQAGLAVAKRAYGIYRERKYEAMLLVAALRGPYHLTELAGADLVMSIHPNYQGPFVTDDFAREARIDRPVPADVIERLQRVPDFARAYEPDGMEPSEFMTFGLTQRTLSQFDAAWKELENYT
jgi:transaldolase